MNATDRNHYNLIPPISPSSSNSSFHSMVQYQMNTKCQQHNEPDLNSNTFISKNIIKDIIGLSSYEPEKH